MININKTGKELMHEDEENYHSYVEKRLRKKIWNEGRSVSVQFLFMHQGYSMIHHTSVNLRGKKLGREGEALIYEIDDGSYRYKQFTDMLRDLTVIERLDKLPEIKAHELKVNYGKLLW